MTSYDVAVIGGGASGTGLARDFGMRGLRCLLVEQGDLCHGTSGRFHGLLHSGARYAVRDPQSARECILENRVVRRIAAQCVEDTGGLFCWLRGDPEDYPGLFLEGCRATGIEVEELTVEEALHREPLLSHEVRRIFHVPDANVQPFDLAAANARSAEEHGASIRRYTRLEGVELGGDRIVALQLRDLSSETTERVEVGMLVSAAGAWAGRVAALAGVQLAMSPGWGTMVIMNQRLVRAVVNRCRLPGDGDIIVPVGTVCIAGTTDRTLEELDYYEIRREEVLEILEAGAEMVPALAEARVLRVYAGARPMYDPRQDPSHARALSRSHSVLDHAHQGVSNFVSLVGGKLTTYRLMAEHAADAACAKMNVTAPCRTADEPLPGSEGGRYWWLGTRFSTNEAGREGSDADLLCECEVVTRAQLEDFFAGFPAAHLDDALRGLRVGMGPCQGAFCAPRAAAMLEGMRRTGGPAALLPLRDFLEERLKGNRPILWGDQARQYRLTEIIYRETFALDQAPDPGIGAAGRHPET